jgi:hypothetical protein
MIILSWNCRGLGNPQIVQFLRRLVKMKKPQLVFLMETRLQQNKADQVRSNLGFDNCFVVGSRGKSGGLMLLWNSSSGVEIQNFSRRHINAVIQRFPDDLVWKFTGFYGHPEVGRRGESWALLRHLATLSPVPWLCLGDFNEIISMREKSSKPARPYSQMRAFQSALTDSGLGDLGFKVLSLLGAMEGVVERTIRKG